MVKMACRHIDIQMALIWQLCRPKEDAVPANIEVQLKRCQRAPHALFIEQGKEGMNRDVGAQSPKQCRPSSLFLLLIPQRGREVSIHAASTYDDASWNCCYIYTHTGSYRCLCHTTLHGTVSVLVSLLDPTVNMGILRTIKHICFSSPGARVLHKVQQCRCRPSKHALFHRHSMRPHANLHQQPSLEMCMKTTGYGKALT